MSKVTQFAAVAIIGVVAGFVGAILAAPVLARRESIQKPQDVIRAKQFEAIGENGKVRARFGLDGGVPVMTFLGSDGKERFFIMLDNVDEPIMMMKDINDNTRAVFGHETSDTASPTDDDWYLSFLAPGDDYFWAQLGILKSHRTPPSRKYRGVVGVRDVHGNWRPIGPE